MGTKLVKRVWAIPPGMLAVDERSVLMALAIYAKDDQPYQQRPRAWPSLDALARACGWSNGTAASARLKVLQENGYISAPMRREEEDEHKPNSARAVIRALNLPPALEEWDDTRPMADFETTFGVTQTPKASNNQRRARSARLARGPADSPASVEASAVAPTTSRAMRDLPERKEGEDTLAGDPRFLRSGSSALLNVNRAAVAEGKEPNPIEGREQKKERTLSGNPNGNPTSERDSLPEPPGTIPATPPHPPGEHDLIHIGASSVCRHPACRARIPRTSNATTTEAS